MSLPIRQLSTDDRCVVDLLLESAAMSQQSPNNLCFTSAPSEAFRQRLARAEQLLHTLDAYVPADPPADLLDRTLARCDWARNNRPAPHMTPDQQPVAGPRPNA